MKVLVLGGTKFVGRSIVDALLAQGHSVSIFTRGQTNADVFEGKVEKLVGDRLGDCSALASTQWDAVVDTSAYVPRAVDSVAEYLRDATRFYLFISTISVYDDPPAQQDESGKLLGLDDPATEVVDGSTYGGLKVLCEKAVQRHYNNVAIVRPGIVAGPHDPTDRFTFWVWRMSQGGEVPVPNCKETAVQVIDARDLAAFVARLVTSETLGIFNAAGPQSTFGEIIEACLAGTSSKVLWLSPAAFQQAEVEAWSNLPLLANLEGKSTGLMQISSAHAVKHVLVYRPLAQTVEDTRTWSLDRDSMNVGMSPEQEEALVRSTSLK